SISYGGQGRDIVILDVIPWRVGDIDKGPGARLRKTKRYGLSLKAGERAGVDIPVIVERVGPAPTPAAAPQPVPGGGTPRSRLRGAGTGVLALGAADASAQEQPPATTPTA